MSSFFFSFLVTRVSINWRQARIAHPNFIEQPKRCVTLLRGVYHVDFQILRCRIIHLYFYVINMADAEACKKKVR